MRAIGDPGTTELFALPNYIYYFVVNERSAGEWKVWYIKKVTASGSDWKKIRYIGPYATDSDSIFQYTKELILALPKPRFNGRIYIIASAVDLTFSPTIGVDSPESELLNMKFSIGSSDEVKNNLQNIYSTPYNYKGYGTEYYGSFFATQNVPHFNLLLYHVAAKVDLMWNVQEDMRIKANPAEAVRLTYLGAQHLFNSDAYCFKPMRNELPSKIEGENGYGIADIVTPSDEGLWWEGRDYFYTIPYVVTGGKVDGKSYFPLQMLMRTNGSDGPGGYQLTLNMQIDTSAVFVPWLRANFNLKQPLGNTIETKTVDY